MSSSIAIPAGPSSGPAYDRRHHRSQGSKAAVTGSSASSYDSTPATPSTSDQSRMSSPGAVDEAKSAPGSLQKRKVLHSRRPSLLSSAISKQECTTINIGDPDGPPRLISYLASSQGFMWNPEIFLPSYVDCEYTPLENRREPVHDILLSDEEIKDMIPQ